MYCIALEELSTLAIAAIGTIEDGFVIELSLSVPSESLLAIYFLHLFLESPSTTPLFFA